MRYKEEEGQALLIVALAMSIFLFLGVGLAVDGSNIYAQRQMAQTAADAAAQAGIMSIFDGTNSAGAAAFSTGSSFNCTTTDARTPCAYASQNGFGGSPSDTVTVAFPADAAAPGVKFSTTDPINLIQVTVQRSVSTTLMRLFGPTATTVQATAMAAILNVASPVPILVTHPNLEGSFSMNGSVMVKICGGPHQSIQVNSLPGTVSAPGDAVTTSGNKGTIDLSHAGPPDPGNCTTGNGADFGTYGGPSLSPFNYLGGATGKYLQPASPIDDPLANVNPPPIPNNPPAATYTLLTGQDICPASATKGCTVYSPGLYTGGISETNTTVLFKPGIYYIQGGGFSCGANCDMQMATGAGLIDDSSGTNTGWTGNMLVYNSYPPGKPSKAKPINIGANGSLNLVGSPSSSSYLGMLFFEDRSAPALSHSMGGGGTTTLQGTIYLTNDKPTMISTPTQYQTLTLQGNSGSGTLIDGEIIVGALSIGGNGSITMDLNSSSNQNVREVALVN